MKKFLYYFFLFNIPIILLLGSCYYVLYISGEIYSKDSIIKPLDEKQLLGLAYTDISAQYKFNMCDIVFHPDIIALGSSRILQVKKDIISSKFSFYNAGMAVVNIYHYKLFLDNIKVYPKFFILNIDQWYFHPNYENINEASYILSYNYSFLFNQCTKLVEDILYGKIDFQKILDNDNNDIGISAIINKNGFTNDGSFYYGKFIKEPSKSTDYNFKETNKIIDQGNGRFFQYCDEADTIGKEAINSFLSECEKKNISVIAFLPPFAPVINERMEKTKKYKYMSQIYDILLPVFEKHNRCYLYDYSDMRSFNVHNYDFVDGYHGSELIYNLIIKDIIKKNEEVAMYFKDSSTIDSINIQYKKRGIRYHDFE